MSLRGGRGASNAVSSRSDEGQQLPMDTIGRNALSTEGWARLGISDSPDSQLMCVTSRTRGCSPPELTIDAPALGRSLSGAEAAARYTPAAPTTRHPSLASTSRSSSWKFGSGRGGTGGADPWSGLPPDAMPVQVTRSPMAKSVTRRTRTSQNQNLNLSLDVPSDVKGRTRSSSRISRASARYRSVHLSSPALSFRNMLSPSAGPATTAPANSPATVDSRDYLLDGSPPFALSPRTAAPSRLSIASSRHGGAPLPVSLRTYSPSTSKGADTATAQSVIPSQSRLRVPRPPSSDGSAGPTSSQSFTRASMTRGESPMMNQGAMVDAAPSMQPGGALRLQTHWSETSSHDTGQVPVLSPDDPVSFMELMGVSGPVGSSPMVVSSTQSSPRQQSSMARAGSATKPVGYLRASPTNANSSISRDAEIGTPTANATHDTFHRQSAVQHVRPGTQDTESPTVTLTKDFTASHDSPSGDDGLTLTPIDTPMSEILQACCDTPLPFTPLPWDGSAASGCGGLIVAGRVAPIAKVCFALCPSSQRGLAAPCS